MIIWIASYPKSGNTYIRSFIASYYFSKKGKFSLNLLSNILQFPSVKFSKKNIYSEEEAAQSWIYNQNIFFSGDKIHFLKTHNSLDQYTGYDFTSNSQTLAAIYIVRDPRNVITSMTNHYSLSYENAFLKMLDKNSSLLQKVVDTDYSGYTYLGSWSSHYKSWKDNKKFKTLFIKYEDLEDNKYETFKKIVKFINNFKKDEKKIDEKKLINAINSTSFSNLRNLEKNEGFEESMYSKNMEIKINFFHLGFNNRWKKILPKEILNKLNNAFQKDINELGYN
ncbi:sulfotransferase domain-containing protein [Candidatus Pelagibacter sp.]|nr:sulfotransferase domain-containing protein [Candidatus Pelagibacter sp.]